MMEVGTCCTRSIKRTKSQPSAGPATRLPATASMKVGATAPIGEPLGCDGSYGEPIDEKRARVIQQALAFEDCQDAMGRAERAEHGGRGGGVGWSDDGAERNRGGPRHLGQQRASDQGNRSGCQSHRKHNQARKRRPVVFEISRRRVVRRIQQHGRDEKREREFGRYSERGRARQKSEERTAERQETG